MSMLFTGLWCTHEIVMLFFCNNALRVNMSEGLNALAIKRSPLGPLSNYEAEMALQGFV